jgi:PAS domain S-box-containing protein
MRHPHPHVAGPPAPVGQDPWGSLRTVVRTRLLVAILALPAGVAFGPAVDGRVWPLLLGGLFAIGLMSAAYAVGIRLRRGRGLQVALQIAGDVLFVTALAAYTGGRGSQFALFYGLVVVTGGLLGRFPGGITGGFASALGFIVLPEFTRAVGAPPIESTSPPGLVVGYLGVLGVLSGMLGDRVARTRADLERTVRELDRVRVDNDAVLRHLTTGVLTVDARGAVAYVNPAAEQVLGVRALECRGRPVQELPARLAALCDIVLDTLRAHSPRARAELLLAGASGRALPLGISTNLLMHDGRVTGVVAVFQDLTEVREMERRARRNETLAQIGALSARVAHELRNGLNPISGSVECLQRELKLEGENGVLMELIGRECQRLNRFVTDLLTFSRDRDPAPEAIDLTAELAEVRDTVAHDRRCVAGTEVRFEPPAAGAVLRADREMLRQVWINLAANAFEAMPLGGTLTVRCRVAADGEVTVEFEDTGAGIAAEDLPRVGQPFFTTKQGGTGLGLAIASRIVERHGGTLSLDSTVGRGTVARVALPGEGSALARAA